MDTKTSEEKGLSELTAGISPLAKRAVALKITDEDGVSDATAILGEIKRNEKKAEEMRVFFVKPLNDQVKKINDLFRNPVDVLKRLESAVKTKILSFRREQEKARADEEARLAKERAKQAAKAPKEETAHPVVSAPAPVIPRAPTNYAGSGAKSVIRKSWQFRVENPAEVPREYLSVNEVAIRAAVRAGTRSIPGVSIFEEENVNVNA